jgi:AcrR family transcriptional regulator
MADRTDTERDILEATRATLAAHGYAELSMAKVAAAFDGSQSLIHYHFDSKAGLLAALLERDRERLESFLAALPADPADRLDRLVERQVLGPLDGEAVPAYVELHARAGHSEPVREALADLEDALYGALLAAVEDAVEAGLLAVDPEPAATLLLAVHDAAFVCAALDTDRDLRAVVETFLPRGSV